MAQSVVVRKTDDIDGGEAVETVVFALDGRSYEIDLTAGNAEAFRRELAPWVACARRVPARRPRTRNVPAQGGATDPKAVRAWAAGQGIEVPARGRISSEVLARYRESLRNPG